MKNPLCWIQLSDLHLFASTEWNIMENEYESVLNNQKVDFVIITGDLHQFGDDYSKTLLFLNNLTQLLGINKNDVFIVPGNHDINSFDLKELILNDIYKEMSNNPEHYYRYYDKLLNSYVSFKSFLKDFYQDYYSEYEKVINGHHLFTWKNQINILAMNSTLICNGKRDHYENLNIRDLSTLSINNGLPTIACSHHNIDDLLPSHSKLLSKVLTEQNVSAYLCGDQHLFSEKPVQKNDCSIECITCAKSACESQDTYSQFGFILYKVDTKDNCTCHPYLWEGRNNFRFEPYHGFEKTIGSPKSFKLCKTKNRAINTIANKRVPLWSIWLPDAELATGKETRFETFTSTSCVSDFLDNDTSYWGIASVKGIGKTFLLQVKRVQMTSKTVCYPYFQTPSKDNNWATEAVKFNNLALFNNTTQKQLAMLWRFSIVCYIEKCWISSQQKLSETRRNKNYHNIIQWINNQRISNRIPQKIIDYLLETEYSKLTLIVNDILNNKNWENEIPTHYNFLNLLGNKIVESISNNKKNSIALFLDKIDQSMRQPNSEDALDCSICSKSQRINNCHNANKGSLYCFGTEGDLCPQRSQCCYGCENFSDSFAGTDLRIYSDIFNVNSRHINYWQRLQLALIEAVNDIKNDFDGKIKVIYTVRLESYNCEADVLGSQRSKILALIKTLSYSREEYEKIYKDCIKNQNPNLLFEPDKLKTDGHEDEAFVGVAGICHPYVNGEIESIFDIIYRHSFDRTRDIQYYGQSLTMAMNRIRNATDAKERGTIVKEIIESTAAKLAYNSDRSTSSTEFSYYFEKIPNMPSYWSDTSNFENLIKLIDRNLLFKEDMCKICRTINDKKSCTYDCNNCLHHPFSTLLNLGMLGYVFINETGISKVKQIFWDAQKITYFHEQNDLPINSHTLYIVHPALTKSIEAIKKDKIMHFSGFLLGKGIEVSQELIRNILKDHQELTKELFEKKYYTIIRD